MVIRDCSLCGTAAWEHHDMRGFWPGAFVVAAMLISGCGSVAVGPAGAVPASQQSASPSLPAFPATLNPDGTVPWVNATGLASVSPSPPPPPAIGPTCTEGQLRGELPTWVSGAHSNDGGMAPLAAASLHGWVLLTNISSSLCTLEGVPAVTLMSRGIPVEVSFAQSATSLGVRTGLPPHSTANFSIDWAAPYCPGGGPPFAGPPDRGPFSLLVTVDGFTLHVPVRSTASPGCVDSTTASSVGAGPIEPGSVIPGTPPAGESSPLRLLRATAHDYPRTIAPGQVLKFVIALANPTSTPVSLAGTPPPTYAIDGFCYGNSTRPGVNFGGTYSLNNRAQPVVDAHGSVRFAMDLAIPASGCPTARLMITWTFPDFIPQGTYAFFTTTVTG
jgi:hypothetical protein